MNSPCVEWEKSRNRDGYGWQWRAGRMHYAHRLAYVDSCGPIPDGMTVDHLCFNRGCVNPDHLRLLTLDENRANQQKTYRTHCKYGHEFTPENTLDRAANPKLTGRRECRKCQTEAGRRYRARTKAASQILTERRQVVAA